ncbi:MAG: hypothetical protein CVT64_09460, partial [Actinobacteria bacterium HGW-Actinobacteria-4]
MAYVDVECVQAAGSWSPGGVDFGWWDELDFVGDYSDLPAVVVDVVVTSRTQHHPVDQVRASTVAPPLDVVGFAVFGRGVTLRAP